MGNILNLNEHELKKTVNQDKFFRCARYEILQIKKNVLIDMVMNEERLWHRSTNFRWMRSSFLVSENVPHIWGILTFGIK